MNRIGEEVLTSVHLRVPSLLGFAFFVTHDSINDQAKTLHLDNEYLTTRLMEMSYLSKMMTVTWKKTNTSLKYTLVVIFSQKDY